MITPLHELKVMTGLLPKKKRKEEGMPGSISLERRFIIKEMIQND